MNAHTCVLLRYSVDGQVMAEEITLQTQPEANPQRSPFKRVLSAVSEDHLFLSLAVVIGVLSALAIVAFRFAILWTQAILLGTAPLHRIPRVILSPVTGGLIVALLVIYV